MPVFLGVVPALRMFDPPKTLEFYVDFLGFKIDWEHRFSSDLPLYLQISMKDIVLHLSEHYGDATPGAKVFIHMKGIAKFQAALSAKKYRFAKPGLVGEPYGATTMTVYDPASNRLVFSESDES